MLTKFKIFINSEKPEELIKFYTDVMGFKIISTLNLPRDRGYMLEVAPGYEIWLAYHSEVKGYNTENLRHMINLYSDNIEEIYQKVMNVEGVKIIQDLISMAEFNPAESRKVFTFLDPEGNCLQVMESRK